MFHISSKSGTHIGIHSVKFYIYNLFKGFLNGYKTTIKQLWEI
nr:MAG TPA: hypothetical protein [Bacteriophage sp.]